MEKTQVRIPKRKKPTWKGYILYDSNCMTFWEKPKCGDSIRISGCQGWGKKGMERQSAEDFEGRVTTLYDPTMVGTRPYTFVQTQGNIYMIIFTLRDNGVSM